MKIKTLLREYNRDITITKNGPKLLQAMRNDRVFWNQVKDFPDENKLENLMSHLETIDPDKRKKHVQWLVKQYVNRLFRVEDAARINQMLKYFIELKPRLQRHNVSPDINTHTLHELEAKIEEIMAPEMEPEDNLGFDPEEVKVLYSGPLGLLAIPLTQEASCGLGSGTKWCTAAGRNNMFNMYSKDGPLYIWKDRNGDKYQFWFDEKHGSDFQFMDAQDRDMLEWEFDIIDNFRNSHPVMKKFFETVLEPKIFKHPNIQAARMYAQKMPLSDKVKEKYPHVLPLREAIEKFGENSREVLSIIEYFRYHYIESEDTDGTDIILRKWESRSDFVDDCGNSTARQLARHFAGKDDIDWYHSIEIEEWLIEEFFNEMPGPLENEIIALLTEKNIPGVSAMTTGIKLYDIIYNLDPKIQDEDEYDRIMDVFVDIREIVSQSINDGYVSGSERAARTDLINAVSQAEVVNLEYGRFVNNADSVKYIDEDTEFELRIGFKEFLDYIDEIGDPDDEEYIGNIFSVEDFMGSNGYTYPVQVTEPRYGYDGYDKDVAYENFQNEFRIWAA